MRVLYNIVTIQVIEYTLLRPSLLNLQYYTRDFSGLVVEH